uniref:Structural maintenance of chromosomes protein 4-like n=1 Tax=Sinocyclocheilus anshuiensis TaxID=1608454 RepID=A0A671LJS8_9TELE
MPAKTKSSTAAKRAAESDEEQSAARRPPSAAELDNRSLEEILTSIPPPPPPAMSSEPGAPRLMITHIVNRNFKSYAGEQILGPFHKRFSCIIGPNGSGKSNVIDSMLFVFGYRAQKIRSKKLSVLIHSSDTHPDIQSCTVEVHFQKIIDKEGDDYDVIPNSSFYVSRTAAKDNSSSYHINGKKATFKDVGALLRSHGIDLDHNRFLILQGEVEQIAMMKPKGQTEHDEGMLEYLEDIIGSCRLKEPINILCRRVELLNEQRGEKLNRVKLVEKEKSALEGEKNKAVEFLSLENDIFKKRNLLCQFYVHDLQKRVSAKEAEKQQIQEDTKELSDKSSQLTEEMKTKNEELKGVENICVSSAAQTVVFWQLSDIYLSQHNTAVSQLNQAKDALQEAVDTLRERRAAIKHLNVRIPQCEEQLKTDEQELEQISEQDQQKRLQVGDMRQKVAEAKSSLSTNRSRNKVLDSLMQQKRSGKIPGILGRLGDLGAVDEKYDVAISSSCGSLDNILVDTIDTAQRCVTFLKTQNIGVATFIGLDKMKVWQQSMGSISTPESIPRLFDMVRVKDESVRPAFYFALRDTLVARDLEQATRVAFQKDKRWRVVTLQGQIIEQAGTMTGGGGRVMKGRMGSSVCADVTQEQLDKMESELNKELMQLQDWQQRKHQLEEKVHKARRELRDMKNTLEKYTATIQSLTEQELHLKTQIKDLEANVISAAPDKAKQKQMEKSLEVYRKDFEAESTKAGKVEAEVKRLHTLIVDINSHKLKAQQDKLDQINTQLDECSSAITKAQVAIKTAGRNLKKSEDSVSQLEKEMGENEKLMEELTEQLKKLEEAAGEIMQTYQQEALPEVQEQHRGVLQQIKALQEQEHVLQKESLSVRLKVEHIDTAIAECHNKIKHWEREASRLSLHPIDGAPEEELPALNPEQLEDIGNPDVIKNEIALLEDRCSNMKPNLGAIAEFKKKVPEIHSVCLAILVTAWCFLCVPSVRPPKKSWKKIYNLSGGEKTLSSLALVFALHHFKPTPLYFMDEIDAALDFKNVSIVACYIYEQTKNAQFIIISLRNNMFEMANRLIGIYKTHNTTKNVAINPKTIVLREIETKTPERFHTLNVNAVL